MAKAMMASPMFDLINVCKYESLAQEVEHICISGISLNIHLMLAKLFEKNDIWLAFLSLGAILQLAKYPRLMPDIVATLPDIFSFLKRASGFSERIKHSRSLSQVGVAAIDVFANVLVQWPEK